MLFWSHLNSLEHHDDFEIEPSLPESDEPDDHRNKGRYPDPRIL